MGIKWDIYIYYRELVFPSWESPKISAATKKNGVKVTFVGALGALSTQLELTTVRGLRPFATLTGGGVD